MKFLMSLNRYCRKSRLSKNVCDVAFFLKKKLLYSLFSTDASEK
jgi:hypothetical protein